MLSKAPKVSPNVAFGRKVPQPGPTLTSRYKKILNQCIWLCLLLLHHPSPFVSFLSPCFETPMTIETLHSKFYECRMVLIYTAVVSTKLRPILSTAFYCDITNEIAVVALHDIGAKQFLGESVQM